MLFSTIPTLALWVNLVPRAAQHGTAGAGHPSRPHPEPGLGVLLGSITPERTPKPPTPATRRRPPGKAQASSALRKTPSKLFESSVAAKVPTPKGWRCLQTALPALTLPSGSILRVFPSDAAKAPSRNGQWRGREAGGPGGCSEGPRDEGQLSPDGGG